ncbi:hypothetical protein M9458_035057, partial [Cirrhinus mrigala]
NGSPFTISPVDYLARTTPDPEPSPPSPRCVKLKPEPTDDGEPIPAAINEPVQCRATEQRIALETVFNPSDQVRELEKAVDGVSVERSSTPFATAEGELIIHLGLLDFEGDLTGWETDLEADLPSLLRPRWSSPAQRGLLFPIPEHSQEWALIPKDSPESQEAHECLTTHPPAPASSTAVAWHPLCLPSAHHLYGLSSAGLPSSIITVAGESLTSASSPRGLAPPWSGVVPPSPQDSAPPVSPRHSVPPAPLGSSVPPAPPWSSVAPAPPWISGFPPQSPEPWALPWPPRSSASPWLIGAPSPPRAPPPPGPPPSVGPLESFSPWLLPPWLLPLSSWLWPGSRLAPPAPSPSSLRLVHPGSSCFLLGSFLRCLHPGLRSLSSSWGSVLLPSHIPSSHPRLPLLSLRCEDEPSGRGVICQDYGL